MDSIDKLLAQVKAEYEESPAEKLNKKQLKVETSSSEVFKTEQLIQSLPQRDSLMDNLLDQVKTDYQEQDRVEEQLKQQQLKAEQLRQKQLQMQQQKELEKQAIAWLRNLDSLSSEGIWFENFAKKYPSKLAAAIDYLQDIKESDC